MSRSSLHTVPADGDRERLVHALDLIQVRHRDEILDAMAKSARDLLSLSDLRSSLPPVLERIGLATGVDLINIFEVDPASPHGRITGHHQWVAPGLAPPVLPKPVGHTMVDAGLDDWRRRLAGGETIVGQVRDFAPSVRALFERIGVRSILVVPIFVDGCWWGHIGFDHCRDERAWSSAEIDTLTTLAELIGAAVARMRDIEVLADARRIIENSPTILYRIDPTEPYALAYISDNVRQYGYDAAALMAAPDRWPGLIVADDLPAVTLAIATIARGRRDQMRVEFRLVTPDGARVWFEGRAYAVRDAAGGLAAVEGILTNITDRKHAAERIAALARTDAVTGLPNRVAFLERLGLAFARARRGGRAFAVHYLDLDHFKDVNDTLGHPTGDALLQAVAERLQGAVRACDMVARFGGDEFAVLQEDTGDPAAVDAMAAKLGDLIGRPYAIDGNRVHTTASIGVVPWAADVVTPEAMLMRADLALYRAKEDGRGRHRFHAAELDRAVHERVSIAADLHHAIDRDELALHYQPQIDLATGAVVGVEALVRWHHPTRGMLAPGMFIPVAETSGSIEQVGQWVIDAACRQIRGWRDAGLPVPPVAVNLSAAQFKLAAALDLIVSASLDRWGVAPRDLELELTETVLMETSTRHAETLERLRRIGLRLAIDDFGTGYSSLDYLKSFRVSRLKIDRGFVRGVTTNADDAAIVRATIGLAQELGIEVVAEGVETIEQRDFLAAAGCRVAQGYLFARPLPAADLAGLLAAGAAPM